MGFKGAPIISNNKISPAITETNTTGSKLQPPFFACTLSYEKIDLLRTLLSLKKDYKISPIVREQIIFLSLLFFFLPL